MTNEFHAHAVPEPAPLRTVLPTLRRATDAAPFEHPAFGAAVGAAFDHGIDEKVLAESICRSCGERQVVKLITYADAEAFCRTFLVHYIALGGRL